MPVMVDALKQLIARFEERYGTPPEGGVRAPGRVNLIGEHTDYNDGFCLPMAIGREVTILYAARDDSEIRASSVQEEGDATFALAAPIPKAGAPAWAHYVMGCAEILLREGVELRGCDLAISGDVPLGSGLSSSAALEVATMHALLAVAGQRLSGERIARLAQRAENEYVGTNCGILDQLASACCEAGHASLMDCRATALTPAPLPEGVSVVIGDTGKRRGLVDSAYNERRSQCEAGAAAIGVSHLRDVDLHALREALAAGRIDELTYRRCRFVIEENARTRAAAACLAAGDVATFGLLMDASHEGLRADYEVTCVELDDMVAIARALPGCLGSRMTGAGFGGCTVSLVEDAAVDDFARELDIRYRARHDLPAAVYVTRPAAGAGALGLH